MVEDCGASIVPCLHPSSFMAQGCGEPQRQGRGGFQQPSPGSGAGCEASLPPLGRRLSELMGIRNQGGLWGGGSQGPPSDPAAETNPRLPYHPGACPCRSPPISEPHGEHLPPSLEQVGPVCSPQSPLCRP